MEEERDRIQRLAQFSAVLNGELVASQTRLLATLANRPQVRALDPRQCDEMLSGALLVRPPIVNLFTFDARGDLVCAGRPGEPPPALVAEPAAAGHLLRIGHPHRGSGNRWVITLAMPVRDARGEPAGTLQAVLRLDLFRPVLSVALPQGGIAGIVDLDGYVIARSGEEERFVGQRSTSELVRRMGAERAGRVAARGPDGVERLYGYAPIPGTRWIAVTGIPTETLYGHVRRAALMSALLAVLIVAGAAWLALRLSRGITEPIRALADTADRVSAGDIRQGAAVHGPAEVARVADGFNRMMGKARDVLRALAERESRYRSLVELAPEGIGVHQQGALTYLNPRLRSLIGSAAAKCQRDVDLLMLVDAAQRDEFARRLQRLREGPAETGPLALTLRREDGSSVELEHTGSSVLQHGEVVVQSHFLDVTERNRAHAQLAEMNQQLEAQVAQRTQALREANAALESFSSSVAHDLRSPVARIAGFAQALRDAVAAGRGDRIPHYSARIAHSVAIMESMIEGLLQLSRADRAALRREPVDMGLLVASVLAEFDESARAAVRVGELPVLEADECTLRQVWHNLIGNALKYSARVTQPRVSVSCVLNGTEAVFCVEDNGIGFDPAHAAGLFQPFHRLDGAADFEGTGIGLGIVRRIVQRHGGRVWAEGMPGQGARFFFTLPC